MFLHNINYDKFNIQLGNTLTDPHFLERQALRCHRFKSAIFLELDRAATIPTLINDDRFAPAGRARPQVKGGLRLRPPRPQLPLQPGAAPPSFCFPGIFYRGGAGAKDPPISWWTTTTWRRSSPSRQISSSAPPSLVNILRAPPSTRPDTRTQFIDASALFKKETNNNVLCRGRTSPGSWMSLTARPNVPHFAKPPSITPPIAAKRNYNLSVSTYVEAKDTREGRGHWRAERGTGKVTVAKINKPAGGRLMPSSRKLRARRSEV